MDLFWTENGKSLKKEPAFTFPQGFCDQIVTDGVYDRSIKS